MGLVFSLVLMLPSEEVVVTVVVVTVAQQAGGPVKPMPASPRHTPVTKRHAVQFVGHI